MWKINATIVTLHTACHHQWNTHTRSPITQYSPNASFLNLKNHFVFDNTKSVECRRHFCLSASIMCADDLNVKSGKNIPTQTCKEVIRFVFFFLSLVRSFWCGKSYRRRIQTVNWTKTTLIIHRHWQCIIASSGIDAVQSSSYTHTFPNECSHNYYAQCSIHLV